MPLHVMQLPELHC